jgi:hypothetical protein
MSGPLEVLMMKDVGLRRARSSRERIWRVETERMICNETISDS